MDKQAVKSKDFMSDVYSKVHEIMGKNIKHREEVCEEGSCTDPLLIRSG